MSLDPHLRWKGEEEGNPGLVARNTEWFCSSRGVRASAGVEVTIIVSQPMQRYMARRTSNKIEPAVMTLYVPTSSVGGVTPSITEYIDLSQVASLVNRRFYRQGLNWAVSGIKVLSQTGFVGSITCAKLPNTWVMSNAWQKSFSAWQRMNKEALSEAESVRPRFLDFKVYADSEHHAAGYGANLLPLALGGSFTSGEWQPSKFVIPNTAVAGQVFSREAIAVGSNYPGAGASGLNAISLIKGYAASRGLPNVLDPNTPGDAADADGAIPQNWMTALHNDGSSQDEEVVEDMIGENNLAPYPFENDGTAIDTMYPGGANQGSGLQIHDVNYISNTTIGGQTRIKGGNFPCGLVRFDITNTGETSNLVLQIDLIPGNHRGYLCEPMMEM